MPYGDTDEQEGAAPDHRQDQHYRPFAADHLLVDHGQGVAGRDRNGFLCLAVKAIFAERGHWQTPFCLMESRKICFFCPTKVGASAISTAYCLIAEKFVNAGFRPRTFVDALDDHGASQGGPALVAWQRAGNHHRIGWHSAVHHLAARTVDDFGRSPEEDAHRQHGAFLDDDSLGHFRTRADEAIILDDHRSGLQRLENPADPGASRNMDVTADL